MESDVNNAWEMEASFFMTNSLGGSNPITRVVNDLITGQLYARTLCSNFFKRSEAYIQVTTNVVYGGVDFSSGDGWGFWGESVENNDTTNLLVTVDPTDWVSGTLEIDPCSETSGYVECLNLGWTNVIISGGDYQTELVYVEWDDLPLTSSVITKCVSTNCEAVWFDESVLQTSGTGTLSWTEAGTNYQTNITVLSSLAWEYVNNPETPSGKGIVGVYANYSGALQTGLDTNWYGVTNILNSWQETYTNFWNEAHTVCGTATVQWAASFQFEHYYTNYIYGDYWNSMSCFDEDDISVYSSKKIDPVEPVEILSRGEYTVTTYVTNPVTYYPYGTNVLEPYVVLITVPCNGYPEGTDLWSVHPISPTVNLDITASTNTVGTICTNTTYDTNKYCFSYVHSTIYTGSYPVCITSGDSHLPDIEVGQTVEIPYGQESYEILNGVFDIGGKMNTTYSETNIYVGVKEEQVVMWWNESTNGFRWVK